jgi:hypothetical protein
MYKFRHSKRFELEAKYGEDFHEMNKLAIDDFVYVLRSKGWSVSYRYDKHVDNLCNLGIETTHYVIFEIYPSSKL